MLGLASSAAAAAAVQPCVSAQPASQAKPQSVHCSLPAARRLGQLLPARGHLAVVLRELCDLLREHLKLGEGLGLQLAVGQVAAARRGANHLHLKAGGAASAASDLRVGQQRLGEGVEPTEPGAVASRATVLHAHSDAGSRGGAGGRSGRGGEHAAAAAEHHLRHKSKDTLCLFGASL